VASSACRFAAIASMTGIDRRCLHAIIMGVRLSQLIRQVEAAKLRFRRTSPRSDEPNRWEMIDT
jgi:hypothetical protein